MKQSKEQKKKLYNRLIVIFLSIFFVCIVIMIMQYQTQRKAEKQYEALETAATEKEQTDIADTEDSHAIDFFIPDKEIDWDALEKENSDIYAWIYIPGTQVDYPVLQHPNEDDYYLDHNLDHSAGYPGAIYSQSVNAKDFGDIWTVLYGHNMGNGTMFGSLHDFEDNDFFEENQYIYIYTREKAFVYEIYSACTFSDVLLSESYSFTLEAGVKQFLKETAQVRDMNSHVREEMEIPGDAKLITLSTCIKGAPEKRWLVNGILVQEFQQ